MKRKNTSAIICIILILSLLLTAGCGKSDNGGTNDSADGRYKTVTGEQGFTTQCLREYGTKWDDEDGLYIYTKTDGSIPYVLIYRYDDVGIGAEQFLEEVVLPYMQDQYGDDLREAGAIKDFSVGGQSIPGIEFTYTVGDNTVKSLRLCKQIGNDIINFTAKYLDGDDAATMEALDVAVSCFKLGTSSDEPGKEPGSSAKGVKITETPAALLRKSLANYSDPNGCFTAKVPAGWKVSSGGKDMYFWVRIYDPSDPTLQVFTLLKADVLLKSSAAKEFYQQYKDFDLYKSSADALVVTSVEDFYRQFMDYCAYTATYSSFLGFFYDGFEYPQISGFETIESFANSTAMPVKPIDDKILHGTFIDPLSQLKGEGMFSGTLYDALPMPNGGLDVGYNAMYNVNGITAGYGKLGEYMDVLLDILHSVQYTDSFLETVARNQNQSMEAARQLNSTLQATSDIIVSGWNERQKSYDVISAKYSDSIMGYETVYDVETGEVYKAYNGFTDVPGIDKYYLPATDEMYSKPIAGYIE